MYSSLDASERMCVCVCVCKGEREREREREREGRDWGDSGMMRVDV